MGVPDPCGNDVGYQRIAAVYIMFLYFGMNYKNKETIRSSTVTQYSVAINALFTLRGFKPPIEPSNPNNLGGIIIINRKREEEISVQRNPLSMKIYAHLLVQATSSKSTDSEASLLANCTTLGMALGMRASEFSQTSPRKIDYHVYPSGKKVIKAFIADDFVFLDSSGDVIVDLDESSTPRKVRVTWRIQKNRRNGQDITLASNEDHPQVCPVRAAMNMVLRARRLGQPDSLPVACYRSKKGDRVYITASRIAFLFRAAAKAVHPNLTKAELSKYSAHSLRVWACVLLDEAGMPPEFIKARLRWMGNSFRMYLRDTSVIQDKHRDILQSACDEVTDLVTIGLDQHTTFPEDMTMVVEVSEDEMGIYDDDMD